TWHQGGSVATPNTNESQVAQLPNGNLYMTIRSVTGDYRLSSISTDGGITWSPATSTGLVEKSTEGSVIDYNVGAQNHLLLSSTNHYGDRRDLTLRTSLDSGGTWNSGNLIYDSASAYSDLALSPDQTVNLLYERGRFGTTIANVPNYYQQIALTRVNQEWLQTPQVVNTFLDFNEKTSGAASTVDAAILDSSGYALHAIAEGAPTYVAGDPRRGGSALHFQNVGDRVELTKADNLTTQFYYNVDYTMEVGFRTTNHGVGGEADAGILLANGNVSRSSATTWFVEVEDGRIHWEVTDSIGITSDLYGGANLSDGLWHDIAVRKTMTDGQYALFVDGQLVDSLTATIGNLVNFDSILVGQYDFTDKQFFGDIDFVRISDASLAPNQFVSVPEPSSLALAGLGALLLVCTVRLVPRKVQVC
ncbi:MAG TPA: exo-alpha-sialidase, partial [Pirellulales bacterium]|nr:exo-alpha-sialidase [Pirellulales bacterium]